MEYNFADRDDEDCAYLTRQPVGFRSTLAEKSLSEPRKDSGLEKLSTLLKVAGRFQASIHRDADAKREWLIELSPKLYGSGSSQDVCQYSNAQIGHLFDRNYDWVKRKVEASKP